MSHFTVINEEFICAHCQKKVPPCQGTCRNHCPFCLYSKHLDIYPGDRQSPCKGLMRPTNYYTHSKKGIMIVFECMLCFEKKVNKAFLSDGPNGDNYDLILSLGR